MHVVVFVYLTLNFPNHRHFLVLYIELFEISRIVGKSCFILSYWYAWENQILWYKPKANFLFRTSQRSFILSEKPVIHYSLIFALPQLNDLCRNTICILQFYSSCAQNTIKNKRQNKDLEHNSQVEFIFQVITKIVQFFYIELLIILDYSVVLKIISI